MIFDCAVDEFAAYGYRAASISRIVATAKIAKGSFYQYFDDKEDLYAFVVDHALVQRKLQISGEESEKLSELNLTQFLRVLFETLRDSFSGEPKLLKIGMDYMRNQYDPVQKRIYEKYEPLRYDYFQDFIRIEKEQGEIDPMVDADMLGYMLIGVSYLMGRQMLEHGYEGISKNYIDDMMDKIEYILTNGIYKNTIIDRR